MSTVDELKERVAKLEERLAQLLTTGETQSSWRADEYDYKCTMANEYPGQGWEYVGMVAFPNSGQVVIFWRVSRKLLIDLKQKALVAAG